jgi:hypothetical protein
MGMKAMGKGMNRRELLKLTGKATVAIPPLLSLLPRVARSQPIGRVQRVILVPCSYGIDAGDFFPGTPAVNLQTRRATSDMDVYTTPLTSFSGNLSRGLGTAFNSPVLRRQMNLYEGLDVTNSSQIVSHTFGALAGVAVSDGTNFGYEPRYGETIDNILARSRAFSPLSVPIPVLRVQTVGGPCQLSFTRSNGAIRYEPFVLGDSAAFDRVFGDLQSEGTPAASTRDADRAFVLERTLQVYNQLRGHSRLSVRDRELMNQFVENMNNLNTSMANNTVVCATPNVVPEVRNSGQYWAFPGDFDGLTWGVRSCTRMLDNISEVIVNAFICDQTRVVVWANGIWQDQPISGYTMGAQFHSHDDGNGGPLRTVDKHAYFFDRLANLAERLDSIPDPLSESGTLLDNSLILVTNEHGGVVSHGTFSLPMFTIGGFGGKVKTGLYFDCRQRPYTKSPYHESIGRPAKQLLQSVLNAAGLSRSEYINIGDGQGFGDFGMYPFSSSDSRNYTAFRNTHNDPLPYL